MAYWDLSVEVWGHLRVKVLTRTRVDEDNLRSNRIRKPVDESENGV